MKKIFILFAKYIKLIVIIHKSCFLFIIVKSVTTHSIREIVCYRYINC